MDTLSRQQARRTYDRIGALQDTQAFYEDRATKRLCAHADFTTAEAVFEFGCGTGRFAQRLFADFLSATAKYHGIDLSPKMVALARGRLAPYSPRFEVHLSEGDPTLSDATASCDRFVSNYVFDLLSHDDIRAVLNEAHRILSPDGLLCLSGLTSGFGVATRVVARTANWIHVHKPALIGGCRPVDLAPLLPASKWQIRHQSKVAAFGIPSEVVVARRV